MDDRPTNQLTAEQRRLLTKARDRIRKTPGSYDQRTYGLGSVSCQTPSCVAGHIAADNAELRETLADALEGTDLTDESCREYAEAEIHEIATTALGTPNYPVLFHREWPVAWLKNDASKRRNRRCQNGRFVPTPDDATEILDRILDGRLQGALEGE